MRNFAARRWNAISCGFQVNLNTGGQVQTDLSGQVCERHGKQRTHNVYDGKDGHYWQVQATNSGFLSHSMHTI